MRSDRTSKWGRTRAPLALAILILFLSGLGLRGAGANGAVELDDRGFAVSIVAKSCLAQTSDAGKAPARRDLHHDHCALCANACQPTLKAFVLPSERVVFASPGESSRRAWLFRNDPARAPPVWANYWSSRAPPSVS